MAEENIKTEDTMQENPEVVAVEERENKKDKRKRNKKAFLEKHPVAYVLLHMIWSLIIIEAVFTATVGAIFKAYGLPEYFGSVIGGLIYLACHAKRYKPEYTGNIKGGNTALGFKLAAFMGIYWVYILIQLLAWGEYTNPTIVSVSMALMAGICEETIFRVIPVSCLMRQWRDEKKIPVVLAISAISFGLVHAANIKGGAGVDITILQVVAAGMMGVLFCAVYLRSGNILPVILMHGITDFLCFMDATQTSQEGIMITKVTFINILDLIVTIILAAIGLYLVRPAKRAEIIAVWDKKFSRDKVQNNTNV